MSLPPFTVPSRSRTSQQPSSRSVTLTSAAIQQQPSTLASYSSTEATRRARKRRTAGPTQGVVPTVLSTWLDCSLSEGDLEGAIAAYHRADERGDAAAAATLGLVFLEQDDEDAAYDAYSRADERGDAAAAVNLGVLREHRGDLAGAEAAYGRADRRGSADGAFNLGALFEQRGDLASATAAYQRADQRGDAGAAIRLGMLLEREHDYAGALRAYDRAQRSDRSEIAELARSRAQALAFGLSLAEKDQA